MHFVSISSSNIRHARGHSTSTRVCTLIGQILREDCSSRVTLDTITLVDSDLKPCIGCGECFHDGVCSQDTVFNDLYARMVKADALFMIAPHYAPIPAKLCMLLEKMEQIAFLPRFHDENCHSPPYHKPVGIIGHCGAMEDRIRYGYKEQVLDTIANVLGWPVEMDVIGAGTEWPNGLIFPVHKVICDATSVFPIQEYDWANIRNRITPLVKSVYQKAIGIRTT